MDVYQLADYTRHNNVIQDSVGMVYAMLQKYDRPMCSISGGADSDIMLDLIHRVDVWKKVRYVWFNTGMEFQATKRHLQYLEDRYNIQIERVPAIKSIPVCVKEYGVPFLSKLVSGFITWLQARGFTWQDTPYEELLKQFPEGSRYVRWWCDVGDFETYNIRRFSGLKEFLINSPPPFQVSAKCCYYSKKKAAVKILRQGAQDLNIVGIRKAEGGSRQAIKSCFADSFNPPKFFPIFWYQDSDKAEYSRLFKIHHSDCYTVWGLRRTGCAGCPFNRRVNEELDVIRRFEPGMYQAAVHVFGESYEYTRRYREFVANMKSAGERTLALPF